MCSPVPMNSLSSTMLLTTSRLQALQFTCAPDDWSQNDSEWHGKNLNTCYNLGSIELRRATGCLHYTLSPKRHPVTGDRAETIAPSTTLQSPIAIRSPTFKISLPLYMELPSFQNSTSSERTTKSQSSQQISPRQQLRHPSVCSSSFGCRLDCVMQHKHFNASWTKSFKA